MTIASEANRSGPYIGNGVTTVFAYGFRIVDQSHLQVIRADATGAETTLALSTDYTVSGVGSAGGGSITLTTALPSGSTVTILRNIPFTQETDLENQGAYYAETVEDALDLAVMRDQQIAEKLNRAILIKASADGSGGTVAQGLVDGILRLADSADNIDAVADIAGQVVDVATIQADVSLVASNMNAILDASGSMLSLQHAEFVGDGVSSDFVLPVIVQSPIAALVWVGGVRQRPVDDYDVSGDVLTFTSAPASAAEIEVLIITAVSFEDVELALSNAEAAAAAALVDANRADVAADQADASAVQAAASATQAGTSATLAETSATQAAASAAQAGTSAGQAASSATLAETSATQAAASATQAGTLAGQAASSATQAGASATQAEAAADYVDAALVLQPVPLITTNGVTTYSTDANGNAMVFTGAGALVFGQSPFGVLTPGVDYTTGGSGITFNFNPGSGTLFHVMPVPRVTNSEAQAILQAAQDEVVVYADNAEASAVRAEAAADQVDGALLSRGIGVTATVTDIASLDATTTPSGMYRFSFTTTGTRPTGVAAGDAGTVWLFRETSENAVMFLVKRGEAKVYSRGMIDLSWGAWNDPLVLSNPTINGAVTGTAVTQSATDSTAGRLLKVGDTRISAENATTEATDLNNTYGLGFWRFGPATANIPAGFNDGSILTMQRNAARRVQIAADGGAGNLIAFRAQDGGGVWRAWSRIFHQQNILGTVSQASGIPSGAIIERGSDGNGSYVRFADGTQICTRVGVTFAYVDNINSLVFNWTYPKPFSEMPVGTGSFPASGSDFVGVAAADLGVLRHTSETTTATYIISRVAGAANFGAGDYVANMKLMAVGRWF